MDLPGIPLLLPGDGKAGHCGFVTRGGPLCLRRVYDRPEERLEAVRGGRPGVGRELREFDLRSGFGLGIG